MLHFTARIEIIGINPYVHVSAAQAETLQQGWRKPMPVVLQVNGQPVEPWRINMMPAGDGSFYLYLHGDVRRASNTKVGDMVTVNVGFDEQYRNGPMDPMPPEFQEALAANAAAARAWKALAPSRQKEALKTFARLKSPEAKARNLRQAIFVLSGNEGRFMARSWKDGK